MTLPYRPPTAAHVPGELAAMGALHVVSWWDFADWPVLLGFV